MRLPTILPDYRCTEGGNLPRYGWPGGYAIGYVVDDGEMLCADCVNDPNNPVHDASEDADADGWRVDGYMTADWHDTGEDDWTCVHCYKVISTTREDN